MHDTLDLSPVRKEVYEQEADTSPVLRESDEVVEADPSFEMEKYQVVRREFFAHMSEPTLSFDRSLLRINTAAIKRFPNVEFVQLLINPDRQILALKPCAASTRDAFSWKRINKKGKTVPRNVTCKLFYAKLVDLLGWDPKNRYKLLGRIVHANGEYLIVFDLTATEVFVRETDENGKESIRRTPMYPADWKDQFGIDYKEHQANLQINIFDGYAVFTIQDSRPETSKEEKPHDERTDADTRLQEKPYPPVQIGAQNAGYAEADTDSD